MYFTRYFLALLSAGLVSCISISDENGDLNTGSKRIKFGLILVEQQTEDSGIEVTEVTMLGAWTGQGNSGIGIQNEQTISIDPDCEIIFLIKNEKELLHAKTLLEKSFQENGDKLCIGKH